MKIDIIGACTDLGVAVNGADKGPIKLKEYEEKNKKINRIYFIDKPKTIKSTNPKDLKKNLEPTNNFNTKLYERVLKTKKDGNFPIIIGGDHSLAIGSALASIKIEEKLGIIWIDAHADYNTFDTTITGSIHGVPLATISDQNGEELTPFFDGNYYNPKNVVVVGVRDYYPIVEEHENIIKAGVKTYTTEEVKVNTVNIVEEAFVIASDNTNGVHISFDIDVIDPLICPGVSYPTENGISLETANIILDTILKHKDVIKSFDLVEYNPSRDIDGKTHEIVLELLDRIIDKFAE